MGSGGWEDGSGTKIKAKPCKHPSSYSSLILRLLQLPKRGSRSHPCLHH